MVIFHNSVSLPEGIWMNSWAKPPKAQNMIQKHYKIGAYSKSYKIIPQGYREKFMLQNQGLLQNQWVHFGPKF